MLVHPPTNTRTRYVTRAIAIKEGFTARCSHDEWLVAQKAKTWDQLGETGPPAVLAYCICGQCFLPPTSRVHVPSIRLNIEFVVTSPLI
ncbi:hypothetical protein J6590_020228 [Homalodisca vitripennis]|nr:hypothetical protein J6590_020228 [Homalodisca vitripennis]